MPCSKQWRTLASVAVAFAPAEPEMNMSQDSFVHLPDALQRLSTDPATAGDPIKRMFIFDGEKVSANVSVLTDTGDSIHVQPDHDELVLILEGECGFRVGDSVRRVTVGDLIFIPEGAIHGPIIDNGPVSVLSVFAPFFDRGIKNIKWSHDNYA
jgi:quercetin dioxygenase-like cupin family protein